VQLQNGIVKTVFLGKLSLGSAINKSVCLSLSGAPTIEGGHFVFKPVSGAIGSLPVSPWVMEKTGLVKNYFATVFAGLSHEKQILNSLKSIAVTPQEIILTYEPTATAQ
jgi:hypothetical protein